jgi:isocitrate dehydrogenase kinase/phosphatase
MTSCACWQECRFRQIPQSAYDEDDFAAEPWFAVAENDYFPEEFERFMGLNGRYRDIFRAHHGDLFDVGYWQSIQERLQTGEVIDVFPYDQASRLK